jgi:hypothetical protein
LIAFIGVITHKRAFACLGNFLPGFINFLSTFGRTAWPEVRSVARPLPTRDINTDTDTAMLRVGYERSIHSTKAYVLDRKLLWSAGHWLYKIGKVFPSVEYLYFQSTLFDVLFCIARR